MKFKETGSVHCVTLQLGMNEFILADDGWVSACTYSSDQPSVDPQRGKAVYRPHLFAPSLCVSHYTGKTYLAYYKLIVL